MNQIAEILPCDVLVGPSWGEVLSDLVKVNPIIIIFVLVIMLLVAAIITIAVVSGKKSKNNNNDNNTFDQNQGNNQW